MHRDRGVQARAPAAPDKQLLVVELLEVAVDRGPPLYVVLPVPVVVEPVEPGGGVPVPVELATGGTGGGGVGVVVLTVGPEVPELPPVLPPAPGDDPLGGVPGPGSVVGPVEVVIGGVTVEGGLAGVVVEGTREGDDAKARLAVVLAVAPLVDEVGAEAAGPSPGGEAGALDAYP